MPSPADITTLLRRSGSGDREAFDELFEALYAELYQLAQVQRRRWGGDYTLNSTALVHEAYLKLVDLEDARWSDRGHFLAVAARAIRHILISYARAKRAAKRGGGLEAVPLEEANPLSDGAAQEILSLHEALERLETVSQRQAQVVEARFFGGYTIEETAEILGVSAATVKRDWLMASGWLHRELGAGEEQGSA
jgi:RNA polymerase sigma factor (TIGR02999 family)